MAVIFLSFAILVAVLFGAFDGKVAVPVQVKFVRFEHSADGMTVFAVVSVKIEVALLSGAAVES